MRPWLLVSGMLAYVTPEASGACYKHATCTRCITEEFLGGSCIWYVPEGSLGLGTCIAGKPGYTPLAAGVSDTGVDAYAPWTTQTQEGQEVSFTAFNIDRLSDGACYTTQCTKGGTCDFGYYPVQNRPCYSSMHAEWRQLECCRQQRNADGYLRGFDVHDGAVSGQLFFAACCAVCYPGYVNTGCDAYRPGTCERCPAGTFNPSAVTLPGTACQSCQACGPGLQRVSCGPSSPGRCEPCPAGTFKAAGLEGTAADGCFPCGDCPHGSLRAGCGSSNPGTCESCPVGQWFASPFCRACPTCSQGPRHGCGGVQQGVCSECAPSRHEQGDACVECAACPEEPAVEVIPGLTVSGVAERIGCAGPAAGRCVRLAATLQDGAPNCPNPSSPQVVCQESALTLRWVLEGLIPGEAVNCTSETGLCFSGRWTVALRRHLSLDDESEEVQVMGAWWSEELDLVTGAGFIPQVHLPALPRGLAGGAGYFLRVSVVDLSSSCCAASPGRPLSGDTASFVLSEPSDLQEVVLETAATEALLPHANSSSLASMLLPVCSSGESSWSWSAWAACERLAAMQLGAPLGPWGSPPSGLTLGAQMEVLPEDAARAAMIPVAHARDQLQRWQAAEEAYQNIMPGSFLEWQHLVSPAANVNLTGVHNSSGGSDSSLDFNGTSANSTSLNHSASNSPGPAPPAAAWACTGTNVSLQLLSSNCSSPLRPLWLLAHEASLAASEARATWHAEVAAEEEALQLALGELKELNVQLAAGASAVGFDVVRMAQAVTLELWESRGLGGPADFLAAFEKIGSLALFLLGSWGSTWRHSLEWHVQAGLGHPINRSTFSPEIPGLSFGGAAPAIDAVPLAQSRTRVWEPFYGIAMQWLGDWSHAKRRLTGEAVVTSRAQELAALLEHLLSFTADATELLLEPTTRAGSLLLAGPLPNVSACAGSCLRLLSSFAETAAPYARLGMGQQSMRPWLDIQSEEQRLLHAASEVTGLVRGRALALDALLSRLLRLRELQLELDLVETVGEAAREAASRLATLAGASGDLGAVHHWQELRRRLGRAVSSGLAAAGRLGRQRLAALENLAAWALQRQERLQQQSQAGQQSTRSLWSPLSGTVAALDAAMHAAGALLEASLATSRALAQQRGRGMLRLEFDEVSHPVVMANLEQTNSALIWLEPPAGIERAQMYPTALAFLVSPSGATQPLAVVEGGNGQSAQSFVELELRHLTTGAQDQDFSDPELLGRETWAVSFLTQHQRRLCQPMDAASIARPGDPVLPLHGLWLVRVRDGPSQGSLRIDSGTTLRLLFEVEEPPSAPPWHFLVGISDVLYEMAADGDCNGIRPIWGAGAPGSTEAGPTTTRGGDTTTSAVALATTPAQQASDAVTTQAPPTLPARAAEDSAVPRQSEEETFLEGLVEQPLLLALLFGAGLGLCCCAVLLLTRCRLRLLRARRSRKVETTDADADTDTEAKQAQKEQTLGPPADCLSYNITSPSSAEKGALRTCAMGQTTLDQPQAPLTAQLEAQERLLERPRAEQEDDGEASWEEAATPSGASARSQGSSCSSRSSSASSRRPPTERPQREPDLRPPTSAVSPSPLPAFGALEVAAAAAAVLAAPSTVSTSQAVVPPLAGNSSSSAEEAGGCDQLPAGADDAAGEPEAASGGQSSGNAAGEPELEREQHAPKDLVRARDDDRDGSAAAGHMGPSETSTHSGGGSAGARSATCSVVSGRSCQATDAVGEEAAGREGGQGSAETTDAGAEPQVHRAGSAAELLT